MSDYPSVLRMRKPAKTTLGRLLRGLRYRLGLRVPDAAREAGVTPLTWWRWERTAQIPRMRHVGAIAHVLEIPAAAVLNAPPRCPRCGRRLDVVLAPETKRGRPGGRPHE